MAGHVTLAYGWTLGYNRGARGRTLEDVSELASWCADRAPAGQSVLMMETVHAGALLARHDTARAQLSEAQLEHVRRLQREAIEAHPVYAAAAAFSRQVGREFEEALGRVRRVVHGGGHQVLADLTRRARAQLRQAQLDVELELEGADSWAEVHGWEGDS